MSEKWIVDVRPVTWELGEEPFCNFCEEELSTFWIEEFAMGLCKKCHDDVKEDVELVGGQFSSNESKKEVSK